MKPHMFRHIVAVWNSHFDMKTCGCGPLFGDHMGFVDSMPTPRGRETLSPMERNMDDATIEKTWDSLVKQLGWSEKKAAKAFKKIKKNIRQSTREQLQEFPMWGQHELYWLAFYDFARRIGVTYDPDLNERLDSLLAMADTGWWWPYDTVAVLTERPVVHHLDVLRRLHCADGQAVGYSDGWGEYMWHGTRVPATLVTGNGWSTTQIMEEKNAEIRRCAIERMGWDQFIDAAGLELVAKAPDPGNPGQDLFLYDLGGELQNLYSARARILLCTNGSPDRDGTRRRFGIPVPGHHTDPVAAVAETYDATVEEYAAVARRT